MRFLFFLIFVFFTTSCLPESAENKKDYPFFQTETIRISDPDHRRPETILIVEIADTNTKRMRGLMYRSELADDAGMLFLFPVRQQISMWMANTPLSLDMIFLDEQGKIREIVENTVPFSHKEIRSAKSVKGVLEIRGGQSKRLNLQIGDKVHHPFFKLEKTE